jgi:choline/glycine/proline betaine transport protein
VPEGAGWRRRLSAIISHPSRTQIRGYIDSIVSRAFETLVEEFAKRERHAVIDRTEDGLQLTVHHGDDADAFVYGVRPVSHPIPAFALTDAARREGEKRRYYRAEVFLSHGSRGYDIFGYNVDQVITDVINHYDRFQHYLYASFRK